MIDGKQLLYTLIALVIFLLIIAGAFMFGRRYERAVVSYSVEDFKDEMENISDADIIDEYVDDDTWSTISGKLPDIIADAVDRAIDQYGGTVSTDSNRADG